ncbi:MAG: hypothetical protein JXR05_12065 [Flavobacteriaceae bacterium]
MARRLSNKKKNSYNKPNFFGMIQNITIASMNKGQLPFTAVFVIFLVIAIRFPSSDIPDFLSRILEIPLFNSILGWFIAFLSIFVGRYFNKRQRRIFETELRRVTDEKAKLQAVLQKRKLPTSNK